MPKTSAFRLRGHGATRFACGWCGYTTGSKTGLRLHKRAAHNAGVVVSSLGPRRAMCGICMEEFSSTPQLLAHAKHTGHFNGR